ncbi:hypothetical protein [Pectinatus haikarae]|uniref:hypothetical protein n=1 Tax=Pectinatus haikarae TaxID=349096 RepID=UPI0018C4CF8D|nr:hypothetical protein [Pectinatus haikarae]
MDIYEVQLLSTGPLTQLPDSQKLFGALVYMYSEKYGDTSASILTKSLLNKDIYFSLSNLMPKGYIPTPLDYIIDCIASQPSKDQSDKDKNLKKKRKALKKRNYILTSKLKELLNDLTFGKQSDIENIFPYINLDPKQQLRASIESSFYDIPVLDSKLYSVPTINISEVSLMQKEKSTENKEQKSTVNKFCFYLRIDNSEICTNLLNMIQEAVRRSAAVILGKRASQGLNTFKFQDISRQNMHYESVKHFINTGMLLPENIDYTASTLKLFTSERRPFNIPGGWDSNFTRYYISFIAEGSIITASLGANNTGKSIPSPFNPQRDIVFGNAFLYPLPIQKRQVQICKK